MKRGSSIVALMDRVVFNVRLRDSSNHMEVDRVAAKLECMTDIVELAIFNFTDCRLVTRGMEHYMSAILVSSRGFRVTAVEDVSC